MKEEINVQEGRKQREICGHNCAPPDKKDDFIRGVESQTSCRNR
jgi:hypothetical protein